MNIMSNSYIQTVFQSKWLKNVSLQFYSMRKSCAECTGENYVLNLIKFNRQNASK